MQQTAHTELPVHHSPQNPAQATALHQLFQQGAFWRQPFCLCQKMHLCCHTLYNACKPGRAWHTPFPSRAATDDRLMYLRRSFVPVWSKTCAGIWAASEQPITATSVSGERMITTADLEEAACCACKKRRVSASSWWHSSSGTAIDDTVWPLVLVRTLQQFPRPKDKASNCATFWHTVVRSIGWRKNQSWFNAILLSETARNFFQFGSRWSGWLILTRSVPAAALRSRSDDLMLSGRYLSTTKSTRPPLTNPYVAYRNTWSARCENVSPVGRVVWSTELIIPSSINAAMGGTSSTASREIAGKTHTFWFDWGPAGERPEVGIQSSSTKLSHIHRKWRASSLPLYVREIDTSGGGRIFGSTDFI